ncbi:MAG TPA: hypothetical protein VET66_06970 [Steroidobacteraceae bacterium]|nr:hypothetical protein [Steroidobacteraceae bacterium]
MSRLAELEMRRAALLARCEVQRVELAQRVGALRTAGGAGLGAVAGGARAAHHPLAWIAALAGMALMGRTRDVLTVLAWVRTALTVGARIAQLLGLINTVRARRSARRAGVAP